MLDFLFAPRSALGKLAHSRPNRSPTDRKHDRKQYWISTGCPRTALHGHSQTRARLFAAHAIRLKAASIISSGRSGRVIEPVGFTTGTVDHGPNGRLISYSGTEMRPQIAPISNPQLSSVETWSTCAGPTPDRTPRWAATRWSEPRAPPASSWLFSAHARLCSWGRR